MKSLKCIWIWCILSSRTNNSVFIYYNRHKLPCMVFHCSNLCVYHVFILFLGFVMTAPTSAIIIQQTMFSVFSAFPWYFKFIHCVYNPLSKAMKVILFSSISKETKMQRHLVTSTSLTASKWHSKQYVNACLWPRRYSRVFTVVWPVRSEHKKLDKNHSASL